MKRYWKILTSITLIAIVVMIFPQHAFAAWYNTSWPYRVSITSQNAKVDADLTNFPVYVNLNNMPAAFWTHVKSDCSDIRMTSSDGITEIPVEVVYCSNPNGEIHFKAPTIANASDTVYYIYYGNAAATLPAAGSTFGSQNVWDANYKLVQHGGNGASITATDSTSNANNGTTHGSVAATTGQLGGGVSYPGTSGSDITVADANSLDITTAWTISLWYKAANLSQTTTYLLGKGDGAGDNNYAVVFEYTNDLVQFYSKSTIGTFGYNGSNSDLSVLNTNFHDYQYTYDGSHWNSYKDAVPLTQVNGTLNLVAGTGLLNIGSFDTSSHNTNGVIDELRISNIARAATWISTEYNNESSPSTFYAAGSEEGLPATNVQRVQVNNGTIRINGGAMVIH